MGAGETAGRQLVAAVATSKRRRTVGALLTFSLIVVLAVFLLQRGANNDRESWHAVIVDTAALASLNGATVTYSQDPCADESLDLAYMDVSIPHSPVDITSIDARLRNHGWSGDAGMASNGYVRSNLFLLKDFNGRNASVSVDVASSDTKIVIAMQPKYCWMTRALGM
jgi:hypothetical protein